MKEILVADRFQVLFKINYLNNFKNFTLLTRAFSKKRLSPRRWKNNIRSYNRIAFMYSPVEDIKFVADGVVGSIGWLWRRIKGVPKPYYNISF